MNKVILTGRVCKDIDLKFLAGSGNAVSKFSIAVNRQFKRDEADFINCVAFGKQAETIAQYFQKGDPIAIVGRIQTGSYETQDGTKRYTTDVIVESFEFVSGKKKEDGVSYKGTPFDDDMTPDNNSDAPF